MNYLDGMGWKKRSRLPIGDGYNNGTKAGVEDLGFVVGVGVPLPSRLPGNSRADRMKGEKKIRGTDTEGNWPTLYTLRRGNHVLS